MRNKTFENQTIHNFTVQTGGPGEIGSRSVEKWNQEGYQKCNLPCKSSVANDLSDGLLHMCSKLLNSVAAVALIRLEEWRAVNASGFSSCFTITLPLDVAVNAQSGRNHNLTQILPYSQLATNLSTTTIGVLWWFWLHGCVLCSCL